MACNIIKLENNPNVNRAMNEQIVIKSLHYITRTSNKAQSCPSICMNLRPSHHWTTKETCRRRQKRWYRSHDAHKKKQTIRSLGIYVTGGNDERHWKASEAKSRLFGPLVGGAGWGGSTMGSIRPYSVSKKGSERTGTAFIINIYNRAYFA